jgi:hypothetical protein
VPTIAVPTPSQRFAVGEQVVLQGSAVDAQDGQLPSSSLSWTVLRHHGTSHTHPWLTDVVGNNVPMPPSPSPEDVFSASTSYLEIRLTATDSKGLSATTVREFRPRTVDLTFATVPAGLQLELFAADVTAPFLLPAWEAWQFGVSAARQKDSNGRTWIFDSWSDGGAASHTITTGTTPATYTATFHENRAPVASSDAVSAVEDTARTVTLPATDADADPVTYKVTRSPANGTVGAPNGNQVVYTPGAQFYGSDSFGFTATDGDATSVEANVAVTVTEVNDPPTAASDSATTAEDTPVLIDARANDSKGPANESPQTLTITSLDDPPHGTASIQSGQVRYAPDVDYAGLDSFGYRVCDNGTANGAPDPLCANGTIGVTVTPVNDAPVAVDDGANTPQGTSVLIDVSANDSPGPPNEGGQSLTLQPPSDPPHGAAVIEAGKVRYTPDPGFAGVDAFGYSTCDNGSPVLCASATVSVNVSGVNHAPVASPGSASVAEDIGLNLHLQADDTDGDSLSFTIVTPPSHGTLGAPIGVNVLYTPAADYNGPDSFVFKASDGHVESGSAAFSLTVTALNDPPVAVSDAAVASEDSAVVLDLVANDLPGPPNESGQSLRVTSVGAPGHGSAVLLTSGLDAGKVRYTPAPDYNGPDTFGYEVCDNGTTNGAPDPKCAGSAVAFSFSPRSPLSIALPQVAGGAVVGRSVQADPGRWSPGVRDTEFQWLRCNLGGARCTPIPGATGPAYVLRVADIRRRLRVQVTVANRFGRSSALSTSTPPIPSPVVFSRIVFDPHARSQHESVALRNVGIVRIQLRGWAIGDGDGNRFRFGPLSLRRGRAVSVETGTGVVTATRRFWHRKQVWDDRGERAVLRTPSGALADSCRYRAVRSGAARC